MVGGQGKDGLWVVAAKGADGAAAAFVVNDSPNPCMVDADLGDRKPKSCRITDEDHTDEDLPLPDDGDIEFPVEIPPHAILLVNF